MFQALQKATFSTTSSTIAPAYTENLPGFNPGEHKAELNLQMAGNRIQDYNNEDQEIKCFLYIFAEVVADHW